MLFSVVFINMDMVLFRHASAYLLALLHRIGERSEEVTRHNDAEGNPTAVCESGDPHREGFRPVPSTGELDNSNVPSVHK